MGVPTEGFDGRTFGRYLRNVRTARNLSLDSVEEMTLGYPEPVTKSHLSRIENGLAAPTFARMYALSQIYGVPISTLAERFEFDLHRGMQYDTAEISAGRELLADLDRLYRSGDMVRALVLCTQAIETADDSLRLELCHWRVVFLTRLDRLETAKIETEQLLTEYGNRLDDGWRFKILCSFVQCCYRLGRYSIARMGLEQLAEMLDRISTKQVPFFHNLSASVAYKTGALDHAARSYASASDGFEAVADTYSACACSLSLAQTYLDMGKTRQPTKILQDVVRTCETHGFQRQHALALSHLCLAALRREDWDAAESYAMRSNTLARPREFLSIVFRNCYFLRRIALQRGDDRAVRSNERSLKSLVNRVDPELDELAEFRAETEGESR